MTTALGIAIKAEYETYHDLDHDTEQTEKDLMDELVTNKVLSTLTDAQASDESNRIDEIHAIYEKYNDDEYRTELEKIGEDISSQEDDLDEFKLDYEREYGDLDYDDDDGEYTSSQSR
ncbi:MAG: hypothetical protein Q9M40_11265 [Sulfurimonas sp.]|nr:hypothetical protein [Sulfurimonas sp.]